MPGMVSFFSEAIVAPDLMPSCEGCAGRAWLQVGTNEPRERLASMASTAGVARGRRPAFSTTTRGRFLRDAPTHDTTAHSFRGRLRHRVQKVKGGAFTRPLMSSKRLHVSCGLPYRVASLLRSARLFGRSRPADSSIVWPQLCRWRVAVARGA